MSIGSTPPVSNKNVPGYLERLTYLESLEVPSDQRGRRLATRAWGGVWPVVLATLIVLVLWQLIHLSGWKRAIFPGPGATLSNLRHELQAGLQTSRRSGCCCLPIRISPTWRAPRRSSS
jgi:hypothetical protein